MHNNCARLSSYGSRRDIMVGELQREGFSIPTFAIPSPLLESLSKEDEAKLRKLGDRYSRLLKDGEGIWARFRSALEKLLKKRVEDLRDDLGYDPAALSPEERQQWRDAHHQEVVPMLEHLCSELGWITDYAPCIVLMFYDDSPEIQQTCFEQMFAGSSMGSPFISRAALTSDSKTGKYYDLVGPHALALQSHLSNVGDVVIKLNLKTISARGLRQLESELLLMKESLEAGKTYESTPGRPKGYRIAVVAGQTWDDIALILDKDPNEFRELQERYVDEWLAQYEMDDWGDEELLADWIRGEREALAADFLMRAKRAARRI